LTGNESIVPLNEEWVPEMGIHWGVSGPHIVLAVGEDDLVVAYEIILPEEDGWHPWFDQPEGEPMDHPALGRVYTQHIYLADPATVNPGQRPAFYDLSWDNIVAGNPGLSHYTQLSAFEPGAGFHYGTADPHLTVMVGHVGQIYGFVLFSPAGHGWHPWFDQPDGQPLDLADGPHYSQRVYVVDPAAIQ
jgi:hypothetical protein